MIYPLDKAPELFTEELYIHIYEEKVDTSVVEELSKMLLATPGSVKVRICVVQKDDSVGRKNVPHLNNARRSSWSGTGRKSIVYPLLNLTFLESPYGTNLSGRNFTLLSPIVYCSLRYTQVVCNLIYGQNIVNHVVNLCLWIVISIKFHLYFALFTVLCQGLQELEITRNTVYTEVYSGKQFPMVNPQTEDF